MKIVECLAPFTGTWQGHNRMRIMPTDEYQESVSAATVAVTAKDFVTVEYTWAHEGQPQNGLLLLGSGPASRGGPGGEATAAGEAPPSDASSGPGATAVWVDSFHSGPEWLTLSGNIGGDGVVRLTGSYPAPEGPDWGWQIHIEPGDGNGGRITMHNVVPGHDPYQVVEATYRRQA
ncbi:hypothetical protein JOE31_001383 [Arthrobacter sp. PvP023]|uniref:DUF1579 family protein n=1 Tax=Micrococcaceae TaxID=1268 RepID=UPI001AEA59B2|nr:DUF1579 family protein [Arthrobacter sp. PvP023]MBP1135151.1 hypothetical protein [Arthrobacter sp. PvP023]